VERHNSSLGERAEEKESGKIDDVIQIKLKYHYEQAEKWRKGEWWVWVGVRRGGNIVSEQPRSRLECLAMSFAQIFSFALLFDEESESTNMEESWVEREEGKSGKLLYLEQTEPEDEAEEAKSAFHIWKRSLRGSECFSLAREDINQREERRGCEKKLKPKEELFGKKIVDYTKRK
jgi:hypothetical protein